MPIASTTGMRGVDLPWYNDWEGVVFDGLRFSEHETLWQPVGLILVASSRDEDPVAQFEELLQPQNLPSLCGKYVLDPNPVRALVLLDIHEDAFHAKADLSTAVKHAKRASVSASAPRSSLFALSSPSGAPLERPAAPRDPPEGEEERAGGESAAPEAREEGRNERLLEQLCAAFPPANCHLLTIGRKTNVQSHWQVTVKKSRGM
uniref:Uncharacterized protein n=1 Tax=Toxoplasma gondii TgCATBr9 TaxID=943120 RepID=A0A2T6ID26_TOXGO|nr:hypothetical protein TGBR9_385640 [Toxoplasma gondii TgCATBr9]